MKKLLLLIALVAGFAGGMKAEDKVTAKVSGTALNIGLENETTFCAFQMDIALPEGVSVAENGVIAVATRLNQSGSDTEVGGTKFIVAYNTLEGNILRVIAYNLANTEITANTGDILNITLSTAVADPTTITIDNILFVKKSDLSEVNLGKAEGENGYKIGDVDENGEVDTLDMVSLIRILLGEASEKSSADIDGNGEIDTRDLVALIKILLN